MGQPAGDVTTLLMAWGEGQREALDQLMPLVYDDLRRVAHNLLRRERAGHTLATAGLIHEAYLRLVDQDRARLGSRGHFYSLAAKMMRRVLIDEARKRGAARRGAGAARLSIDDIAEPGTIAPNDELLALDEVLTRFAEFDPALSQLVELRYFGGLTLEEVAEALGTSTTSVWRDWNIAKAWLYDALKAP
jgi:RNA polymerase sigma factor (TIGR02999 family)